MGTDSSPPLDDLGTPSLKGQTYTTGRGGTGNMARNDDPEEARRAQDLDVPTTRLVEGPVHTGRGGAANVRRPSQDEIEANRELNRQTSRERRESYEQNQNVKGLADKGKDFLFGLGRKYSK